MIRSFGRVLRRIFAHPLRLLAASFALLIAAGTVLLLLPISTQSGFSPSAAVALFTATSAVCVTGLTLVDTGSYWSGFGQGVILLLIQLGGLGIVTLATVVFLAISERVGLKHLRALVAETGTDSPQGIARLVRSIVLVTLLLELVVAVLLGLRFFFGHDYALDDALFHGLFHGISAWNNAGFALYGDSAMRFVDDSFVLVVISTAVVLGGIGFPVLRGLWRFGFDSRRWSLHMKLMVSATAVLLAVGLSAFLAFEWSNPATFGELPLHNKVAAGLFQSVQPRTAGFNAVDMSSLSEESILVTIALMFIGGGSASTAGGIKVTTFALLAFVMWAEIRGNQDVTVFRRRIPTAIQRQALTVSLATLGIATGATFAFLVVSDTGLVAGVFEVVSALGTVGLSMGGIDYGNDISKVLMSVLMFVGRVGPLTLASALAARSIPSLIRYPEDRPLIG
jgi:trk system potassium uptake protein TrkH